jgi:hypothetical protein
MWHLDNNDYLPGGILKDNMSHMSLNYTGNVLNETGVWQRGRRCVTGVADNNLRTSKSFVESADMTYVIFVNISETAQDECHFATRGYPTTWGSIDWYANYYKATHRMSNDFSTGSGKTCTISVSGLAQDGWSMVVMATKVNSSGTWARAYKNDELGVEWVLCDGRQFKDQKTDFGSFGGGSYISQCNMIMDEIFYFNQTLTDRETLNIFTNYSVGIPYPFDYSPPPPSLPVGIINVSFRNLTGFWKTSFKENEYFRVYANFTLSNGSNIANATCNVTLGGVEPMPYNWTGLNYKSTFAFAFASHGTLGVRTNCSKDGYNQTNYRTIGIINIPPFVNQTFLNTSSVKYPVVNGLKVEYTARYWYFLNSVTDNDLSHIVYNLTNLTHTILRNYSRTAYAVNISGVKLVRATWYNFSIRANDTNKSITYRSFKFFVNDTTMPVCSNTGGVKVENGTYYVFNSTCTDAYFFSLNVTCENGFSYYRTNIGNTSYRFINRTFVERPPSRIGCIWTYCDGHTANEIGNSIAVTEDKTNARLLANGISIKTDQLLPISSSKSVDRYTFCFDLKDYKDTFATLEIPAGCYAAPNSHIAGHLVCPAKRMWIDFVNPDVSVKVTDKVYLDLSKVKAGSKVCFNSIGKFNCVNLTQVINVTLPPKNSTSRLVTGFCPDTTPGAMVLAILVGVALFFIMVGFTKDIPVSGIIGSLLLMSLTWSIVDCSNFFGYAMALCSVFLTIIFGVRSA